LKGVLVTLGLEGIQVDTKDKLCPAVLATVRLEKIPPYLWSSLSGIGLLSLWRHRCSDSACLWNVYRSASE